MADVKQWQACAVCGWPLHLLQNGEVEEWLHLRESEGDHIPVPVDQDQIRVNSRCDFCDGSDVTHVVIAPDFVLPDRVQVPGLTQASYGNWAGCAECANLVSRRAWGQLVTRVKRSPVRERVYRPRKMLLAAYGKLDTVMLGVVEREEFLKRRGYEHG